MEDKSVALLRGINVGGKNVLPMKALVEIFEAAGASAVKTYIQSGNVVFRSRKPDTVAKAVREEIAARFAFHVPVVLRSAAEMTNAIAQNPFLKPHIDTQALHLMFLADVPSTDLLAALDLERSNPARMGPDGFAIIGRDVYLYLPFGAAKTKLSNAFFDSRLKTVSTQRNWRTVITLAEMLAH